MRGVAEVLTATDAAGDSRTVPAYVSPEDAVLSLAAAVRYSQWRATDDGERVDPEGIDANRGRELVAQHLMGRDRKSTRLNSSHVAISYAVFCLKKKR